MDHAEPDPSETALPAEHKTVNQIVAYNMRYFRTAAKLTQQELGDRTGLSFRAISAAEKTWERTDGRGRVFDADLIVNLATALGVPAGALLLPPVEDGTTARYLYRLRDQDPDGLTMADLMAKVMPDSDDDTRVMDDYRARLTAAVQRYLAPSWSEEVARWMQDMTGPEIRAERAARLRSQRENLLDLAAELGDLAQALDEDGA